jgi:myo-inositol 2-dehydrogenase / D-chiro-inositol 1-dehydrogenase
MTPQTDSRRDFLKTAAVGSAMAASLAFPGGAFAAADDTLKVGLVGCGGRGTGAAIEALQADSNVKLVAMGDAFEDRLQKSLGDIRKKVDAKVDVKPEACFIGFDAYKKVIERVDVVLLTTPPGFRPVHLKAAVEAGKHIFAEKPCAVDAAGVRSVLESCKLAEKKKLSVVSGLCLRSDNSFRETVRRIHEGQIGDVHTLFANDYRTGRWAKPRQPDWSDMTYQMRNWYNYAWLSGDFNVEQHVHFLDVCAWVMKDQYPERAIGMGGRQILTGPEYGHIYDHFSIIYEYKDGVRLVANTRQHPGTKGDMSAQAYGSKGWSNLSEKNGGMTITAENKQWTFEGPNNKLYQQEHDDLFASIRKGQPINNGEYMAKSTLLAIMGRMAAYTGKEITWDMALNSKEVLGPKEHNWEVKIPEPEVAMPGKTKFV